MKECWKCGGSGGGPDPENECPLCRGHGAVAIDDDD